MSFLGVILLVCSVNAGERTVGLIRNEGGSFEGYTLFSPLSYPVTYLINNEGFLVHSWESDYKPGLMAYLSKDGYLYRSIVSGDGARFDGVGGVQKLDWDGNVVWHYEYCGSDHRQHHDIEVMPSGNVLMIAWDYKDTSAQVQAGRDSNIVIPVGVFPDHIVEVEPAGDSSGNIVWEWHVWDHLVQEHDSTKDNYGVVGEEPELIDVNYVALPDLTHLNAVEYNEELDQIILTSRAYSEAWVIDHSTTTQEAQGHSGGNSGKGGDLLYLWGNPSAYNRGYSSDQRLFGPHDAQWIEFGLPGAGNILVFNNGSKRGYSSVDEIVPPVDEEGNYLLDGQTYGPEDAVWTWTASDPWEFLAPILSGIQRLPNGNTLICDGPGGTFFEVTAQGEEVWRYINPVSDIGPVHQGDSVINNTVFKVKRYPPEYPAFDGNDLTPKGPIELAGVQENEAVNRNWIEIKYSRAIRGAFINYRLGMLGNVQIKLYDASGREVMTLVDEVKPAGNYEAIWDGTDNMGKFASSGVYFCTLQGGGERITRIVLLLK